MRELRTHLSLDEFRRAVRARRIREGYRVAAVFDGDECRAVAGYRIVTNLVSGRHLYVDDLVTAEQWRSHGYGRLLNKYLVPTWRARRAAARSSSTRPCTAATRTASTSASSTAITSFHFGRYFGERRPRPSRPKDPR